VKTRIAVASLFAATNASAQYRLRSDALAYSSAPQSPVGIVQLEGSERGNAWVEGEALVWGGAAAPSPNAPGDAIVALIRVHDPKRWAEVGLGRQIVAMGAIRPAHVDGASTRLRAPTGTTFEAFGGVPVARGFAWGAYDWIAGGRASQHLARETIVGASYVQARDRGRVATEEIGLDFASAATRWFDVATRGAWDVVTPGLVEATASLAGRFGKIRPELYATHRSPARFLPATSLFSALGDAPADVVGGSVVWRAAPRLDVMPTAAVRSYSGDAGADIAIRTTLRLDDRGEGALRLELRRQGASDAWSGVRFAARVPLRNHLAVSSEIELVVPDAPRGGAPVWPWGLLAIGWRPERWEIGAAIEASATRITSSVDVLARVAYAWGAR